MVYQTDRPETLAEVAENLKSNFLAASGEERIRAESVEQGVAEVLATTGLLILTAWVTTSRLESARAEKAQQELEQQQHRSSSK